MNIDRFELGRWQMRIWPDNEETASVEFTHACGGPTLCIDDQTTGHGYTLAHLILQLEQNHECS